VAVGAQTDAGRVVPIATDRPVQDNALMTMTTNRIVAASSTASCSRGRLRGTSRRAPDRSALRYRRSGLMPLQSYHSRQRPSRRTRGRREREGSVRRPQLGAEPVARLRLQCPAEQRGGAAAVPPPALCSVADMRRLRGRWAKRRPLATRLSAGALPSASERREQLCTRISRHGRSGSKSA
jgi:hypothetical protein